MKLFYSQQDYFFKKLQIVVDLCKCSEQVELVRVADDGELRALAPQATGFLLETPEGYITRSTAIMRALALMFPTSQLYGMGLFSDAKIDQWLDIVWNEFELPFALLLASQASSEQHSEQLCDFFAFLDAHLLANTFLQGHTVTLADISLVCALTAVTDTAAQALAFPSVGRYMRTVCAIPSFASVIPPLPSPATSADSAEHKGQEEGEEEGKYVPVTDLSVPPTAFQSKWHRGRDRIKDVVQLGESWAGRTVHVKGWARTIREARKGSLLFVELNDGSSPSSLQVVASQNETEGMEDVKHCGGTGASLSVVGTVVLSKGKGQSIEIQASSIQVLGAVYAGEEEGTIGNARYPLAKGRHSMEFLRTVAHLRPRSRVYSATIRIRNAMAAATHSFFQERGFLYIHTPLLTCSDCEGAGEQFTVTTLLPEAGHVPDLPLTKEGGFIDYSKDFFGRQTSLTVSGQLNVETHCCALGDVYTFGPTFRAENSHTSRHLAEFWMIEPEIAFGTLEDNINLAEDYLKYCVQFALDNHLDDIHYFQSIPAGEAGLEERLRNVLNSDFIRLTYTEAIDILLAEIEAGRAEFAERVFWGVDLASEHERYLTETIYKMPVVLTNYPKDIKAFYMKLDEGERTVSAMDILVPKIGEIMGGSQREDRLDVLTRRCLEMNLPPESLYWYLDLRRFGTMPHAGFGLGFERLVMFITGLDNIRDVIPFPRTPGTADF